MGIAGKEEGKVRDYAWRTTSSLLLVFFPEDQRLPASSRRPRGAPLLLPSRAAAFSLLTLLFFFFLLFTFQLPPLRRLASFPDHNKGLGRGRGRGRVFVVRSPPPPFALHRMGSLHRRGTLAMPHLVVAHFPEDAPSEGLRVFLRAVHLSGVTAWSDVVLVFPDRSSSDDLGRVIREENNAFLRLLDSDSSRGNRTMTMSARNVISFSSARFVRTSRRDKDAGEPPWGRRKRSDPGRSDDRWSYGSIVSFEAGELDPGGSLSGFTDHIPMSLRRWSCYQMLLGRLRRNFKHVMLVDAKNWVVVNDPFVRVLNHSSETVVLWASEGKHHGRGRRESREQLNPGVVVGGMRGVRRMAEAMETGIARAAMHVQQQQRRRGERRKVGDGAAAVAEEAGVMSQVALLTRNVDVVVLSSEDDVADTLELTSRSDHKYNNKLVLRVENNNYGEIKRRLICSSSDDMSDIYADC